MTTRALSGMEYLGFDISLHVTHEPKELTKALRKVLEDHPDHWLRTIHTGLDVIDETKVIYTVVLETA